MQPVAQILVTLLPNGQVEMRCGGPGRTVLLGLLDEARQLIFKQSEKDAAGGGIEIAPPGIVDRLSGTK